MMTPIRGDLGRGDIIRRGLDIVTDKTKKKQEPQCALNRALKLSVTHTVQLRFCYYFYLSANVQLVKRDIVTAVIYCCITIGDYARLFTAEA